jgi:hypothetical protein
VNNPVKTLTNESITTCMGASPYRPASICRRLPSSPVGL